jgi:hypothetical protein
VRYVWETPGIIESLAIELEKGATAGEAARYLTRAFGTYLSRSAVIGKAYRLGLELRSQGSRSPSLGPIIRKARGPNKHPKPPKTIMRMPVMLDEPKPRGDVDDGCRWIVGEATKRNFCGYVTWPLTPWCPFHHARVYNGAATAKSNLSVVAEVA